MVEVCVRYLRDKSDRPFGVVSLAHPDSPLWSVVDRSRMDHHLRRGKYSLMGMVQVLGLLPLFMREHGYDYRKPIEII